MQYLLSFPPGQKIPGHIVAFDASLPAWVKGRNLPGAVSIADLEAATAADSAVFVLAEEEDEEPYYARAAYEGAF